MEAAHQALVDAVQSMSTSQDWLAVLETSRRLPSYSPRNCLLLATQGAQGAVMGYQAWRKIPAVDGGTCQVARGATALKVLAPVTKSITGTDPDTGDQTKAVRVVGFRLVSVFDQTSLISPPDLPDASLLAPVLLEGDAPEQLWEALAAQVTAAGYDLDLSRDLAATIAPANGQADFLARIVCVNPDLPPAQRVKTLAHELAHVHLHGPDVRPDGLTRELGEVEAESVAYLVTAELGLDSTAYTIPYLTGWAGGDTDLVLATADRSIKAARSIADTAHQHLGLTPPTPASDLATLDPTADPSPLPSRTAIAEVAEEAEADGVADRGTGLDVLDDNPDHSARTATRTGAASERAGQGHGELAGELAGEELGEVRGELPPGPSAGGRGPIDGSPTRAASEVVHEHDGTLRVAATGDVVLGTATGAWHLGWEPERGSCTAVHVAGADQPDSGVITRRLGTEAPLGSVGALEERLGFALPGVVLDHLAAKQQQHLREPARRVAASTTVASAAALVGRDFSGLYPQDDVPSWRDELAPEGERPAPASPVLLPGQPPAGYAAALADRPPLRSWIQDGFGVHILAASPYSAPPAGPGVDRVGDPGSEPGAGPGVEVGQQELTYRVTFQERVVFSGDDVLAPADVDPGDDVAVRQVAALVCTPHPDITLTPSQAEFVQTHAGRLQELTTTPAAPFPPDTRITVSRKSAPRLHGTVVHAIGEPGGPATSYAWRPDYADLPGHPWRDNPGHVLITPAADVHPTLAPPDTGLTGWTPATPLMFGAQITFPADDATPIPAAILRAHTTASGLEYDVQPHTTDTLNTTGPVPADRTDRTDPGDAPGAESLRIPADEVTPHLGTSWPSMRALVNARRGSGFPLIPGEVLTAGGQSAYVIDGPDGPSLTRHPPGGFLHPAAAVAGAGGELGAVQDRPDGSVAHCSTPDCGDAAAATVSVGWPSGLREITDACRPCAAALAVERLPRGCGVDITPLTDAAHRHTPQARLGRTDISTAAPGPAAAPDVPGPTITDLPPTPHLAL